MSGATGSSVTVERAAATLDAELRSHPWYISVGVGAAAEGPVLFVYVKSEKHRELTRISKGWQGYPVRIQRTGAIRALGNSKAHTGHRVAS